MNTDILEAKVPGYVRPNFCDFIASSPLPRADTRVPTRWGLTGRRASAPAGACGGNQPSGGDDELAVHAPDDRPSTAARGTLAMRFEVTRSPLAPTSTAAKALLRADRLAARHRLPARRPTPASVQFTPPGSAASIQFGGRPAGADDGPRSQGPAADRGRHRGRATPSWSSRGVERQRRIWHAEPGKRVRSRASTRSAARTSAGRRSPTPTATEWQLQEITERLPGRGLTRRAAHGSIGNVDTVFTTVPPRGGVSDLEAPPSAADPVAHPHQPVAVGIGAADAVVADLDAQRPVVHPRAYLGALGVRVLDDVGERLGDDEVRARLDLRRAAARPARRPDRQVEPRDDRVDARPQPAAREDRREDPVRQLAQLGVALLRLLERLADERRPPRPSPSRNACCASFSVTIVCTSRCCAPSWRSRTTRRRASSPR